MRQTLSLLVFAALAPSCAVGNTPRPVTPPPEAGTVQPVFTGPCASATRANLAPECLLENPEQHRLIGTPCALHPNFILQADTVAVHYDYASSERSGERPGLFINSRLQVEGGCVVGRPFTEVAYCPECRRVRAEFEHTHGMRGRR